MKKAQYIAIIFALLLAGTLYFGFDRKTPEQNEVISQRELSSEILNIDNLIQSRKAELERDELTEINILEGNLGDSTKTKGLRELSGRWFSLGYPEVAGYYAKEIAREDNSAEAWGIAGTTFMFGVRKYEEKALKSYCRENAERAFENAISLNPDDLSHAINLAVLRAEEPDPNNPMLGVQMLLDLNKENPDNVTVLITLARFGMQTGQYDKANDRLNRALEIDPENSAAKCMKGRIYEAQGMIADATPWLEFCK